MPSVFSVALSKKLSRRVFEKIHSANIKTLGKFDVSGSAGRWRRKKNNAKKSVAGALANARVPRRLVLVESGDQRS